MSLLLLIMGVVLFIGLVVVHEWGHFIVARRAGVEVEEFGIFFPPTLYKKKTKAGWNFTINLLPLGGFVKLKGEHDSDTEPGTFGAASLWVKTKIMGAGVVMNLITALVLFTILALIGLPKMVDNQFTVKSDTHVVSSKVLVSYINPGSPAAQAGLKSEDTLVSLGRPGQKPVAMTSAQVLSNTTERFAGQKVVVDFSQQGKDKQSTVTLLTDKVVNASQNTDNPKGHLGVVATDYVLQRSTWSAPIVAVGFSAQIVALSFQGLWHSLAGLGGLIAGAATGNTTARQNGQSAATADVAGPVGLAYIVRDGSLIGFQFMLFLIAYISLALAIMNILPIPALDGGRLWITLFTRAIKHPLSAAKEEAINVAGFVIIIALVVAITFSDVHKF